MIAFLSAKKMVSLMLALFYFVEKES